LVSAGNGLLLKYKLNQVLLKNSIIVLSTAMLILSCKNTANKAGVLGDPQQATIDSLKMEMEK
jgi:hypothetical protein